MNDPAEILLFTVVITYWAAVLMLVRARGRRLPVTVLILPMFFLLLGTIINKFRPPIGTYAVLFVHLLLLRPLWRIANSRRP